MKIQNFLVQMLKLFKNIIEHNMDKLMFNSFFQNPVK